MNKIAIIGAGRIGQALLAGLLKSEFKDKDLIIYDRNINNINKVKNRFDVKVAETMEEIFPNADIIIFAIKAEDITKSFPVISKNWAQASDDAIFVSLAADLLTNTIESNLPAGMPVVVAMPNIAMAVQESLTALAPGRYAEKNHLALVARVFASVGKTVEINESQIIPAAALSGSGPAYAFLLAEAMIDAGIAMGISKENAKIMANQTIKGAGILLAENLSQNPLELRHEVTVPGGSTAAAIYEFDKNSFRGVVQKAIRAAANKSNEAYTRK